MSEVEARTREALHEVVDGLGVTDHDVARMETDLLSALERPRRLGSSRVRALAPGRRRWGLAAAAVAVVAAVAGGFALTSDDREPARPAGAPTPSNLPPSDRPLVPADLVGTWQNVPDSPWVWDFTVDGRLRAVETAAAYLEGSFEDRIVSRTGNVYTVRAEDGCDSTWRIRTMRPGAVGITPLKNSCSQLEVPDEGDELLLERISPDPDLQGELAAVATNDDQGFLRQTYYIDGTWLHVETGTVLVVGAPWGGPVLRYVLDDDGDGATSPDQRGRVTVPETGPPVFRPDGAGSTTCELRFAASVLDKGKVSTTSEGGGCLPGPGPHTWVRIT
ncbi:hypothetical protein [Knoellia aerolata]|uniref:Uncharacterized protein n=1 Tax=Knoellia aerolata DSM 18566 TaxID=1385519 RepID=A0A0A0JVA3_9MICO|nr:hypothetical protein [Knoellia aerolata]KGN41103.1 hypothetical protein N801_09545 [Knoellia aerolata DSM 18566]